MPFFPWPLLPTARPRAAPLLASMALWGALVPSAPLAAATWVVDLGGGGDFTRVEDAVAAAAPGDEIVVEPGEHLLDDSLDFAGKGIVVRSRAGAEATVLARSDTPEDPDRGSIAVFSSGEGADAALEGFTIRGGTGTRPAPGEPAEGGGIRVSGASSPRLVSLRIESNKAALGGGVLVREGSAPLLEDVLIARNRATGIDSGGGLAVIAAAPTLRSCRVLENAALRGAGVSFRDSADAILEDVVIAGNRSVYEGAGVLCHGASPVLTRCRIAANRGEVIDRGAGVFTAGPGAPRLIDCAIAGNGGSGAACEGTGLTLERCAIVGNAARGFGGGVTGRNITLLDCLVAGNLAQAGGGVHLEDSLIEGLRLRGNTAIAAGGGGVLLRSSLVRATVIDNVAGGDGGGLLLIGGSMLRTIVWSNRGANGALDGLATSVDEPADVTFSDIEGAAVWPGEGNLLADPRFCGWPAAEARVDAGATGPGDGTPEAPFSSLADALEWRDPLSLADDSPCLAAGPGGSGIGAAGSGCAASGHAALRLLLAAGVYDAGPAAWLDSVSIAGAGAGASVVEGTLHGLRGGARLEDVTVRGGLAGAVRVIGPAAPILSRVVLADSPGGGLVAAGGASPRLQDARIESCGDAASPGGGLRVEGGAATLQGVRIEGCRAAAGAAVYLRDAAVSLDACRVAGNVAEDGGGLFIGPGSSAIVINTLFAANVASARGGAILVDEGRLDALHVTIAGNEAADGSGIVLAGAGEAIVVNSIARGAPEAIREPAAAAVSYSSVESAETLPGPGNQRDDPVFVAAGRIDAARTREVAVGPLIYAFPDVIVEAPDFELAAGSPARDAGLFEGAPLQDIDGQGRACDAGVDLGAFESGDCPPRAGPTVLALAPVGDLVRCDTVAIEVRLTSPCPVEALSFGLTHDPAYLEPVDFVPAPVWSGALPAFTAVNAQAGPADECAAPAAGLSVALLGLPADPGSATIAAGEDTVVGIAIYRGVPTAPPGARAAVSFACCLLPAAGSPPTVCAVTCDSETVVPNRKLGAAVTILDGACFRRGRCNGDDALDISDAVAVLSYLFSDGRAPTCHKACDANDDGQLDISDGIRLLDHLFFGGAPPPPPFFRCGLDATADDLTCELGPACRPQSEE